MTEPADSRPPVVPASETTTTTTGGLGLEVAADRTDGYWRVSWKHETDAVKSGMFGNLAIDDGGQQRNAALDQAELQQGYVLYAPNSDNVTIRLEVIGPDHAMASESTRVLSPPPVKQVVTPGTVQARPRVIVKEKRRLLIVVANRPPQPLTMEPVPAGAGVSISQGGVPGGTSVAGPGTMPGYPNGFAARRHAEGRRVVGMNASHYEDHRKPHFFKRVFTFVKRPWH